MTETAPYAEHLDRVASEWIDYNGHMNVAYYFLAFDKATDAFFDHLGIGRAYKDSGNHSTFTLEGHITYDRELLEGDPIRFKTYLLGVDAKRLHYFHEMYHAEQGYLAATTELVTVHVDMRARRSAPFPEDLLARLQAVREVHAKVPVPEKVGRVISLSKRKA